MMIYWKIIAKRYEPISRIVKNHVGDNLFKVSLEVIMEFFSLNPNHVVHEKIALEDLQARYDIQITYLRYGPLQENFVKIGHFPLVIENIPNPLLIKYFNPRAQSLYFSLCKIFRMDEQELIQGSIVFIISHTLQSRMNLIF